MNIGPHVFAREDDGLLYLTLSLLGELKALHQDRPSPRVASLIAQTEEALTQVRGFRASPRPENAPELDLRA